MAASFDHERMKVTTYPSPAAPTNNMNAAPMERNKPQSQQMPRHIQALLKGEHKALGNWLLLVRSACINPVSLSLIKVSVFNVLLTGKSMLASGQPNFAKVVQVMVGIIQVTFGVALYYSDQCSGSIGTPWWTGTWYIISGAVSISLEERPKKCLIVGNLAMNILSAFAAGYGMIVYMVYWASGPWCSRRYYESALFEASFRSLVVCLLAFTGFEFAISITASVFGCYGLRCCEREHELNAFVIQSTTAQNNPGQEPQDANYEKLLAEQSIYETLKP